MTITDDCPHTEDIPLLALGALDAAEAASLRAHAATCAACRPILAEHEDVVGRLDLAFAREPAPAFDDLAFPRPAPVAAAIPARAPRRRLAWLGGAATACAVAVIAVALAVSGGTPDPAAVASVHSELAGAATSGQARLFHPERPDGVLKLHLRDVPASEPGTYYAVWVLPKGQATMEAIGSFVPRGSSVDLTLPLPGSGDYGAVDVSIQRTGGPSAHSQRSLAGGAFRAT